MYLCLFGVSGHSFPFPSVSDNIIIPVRREVILYCVEALAYEEIHSILTNEPKISFFFKIFLQPVNSQKQSDNIYYFDFNHRLRPRDAAGLEFRPIQIEADHFYTWWLCIATETRGAQTDEARFTLPRVDVAAAR